VTLPDGELFFDGPAGRIEGVLKRAAGARVAAVVCHPHPQYGGTLYSKVVYRMARAIHAANITVLRFNFRGVEGSEGAFDAGRGEVDDARAALDLLAREHDRLLVAGYSFGAWVGLRAGAADARVEALVGVGAPVDAIDFSFLRGCDKPLLLVHGDRDSWGSVEKIRAIAADLGDRAELEILPGADHSLDAHLEPMMERVTRFVSRFGER
jgi:alpha/beta superfamily hydrolase